MEDYHRLKHISTCFASLYWVEYFPATIRRYSKYFRSYSQFNTSPHLPKNRYTGIQVFYVLTPLEMSFFQLSFNLEFKPVKKSTFIVNVIVFVKLWTKLFKFYWRKKGLNITSFKWPPFYQFHKIIIKIGSRHYKYNILLEASPNFYFWWLYKAKVCMD